MSIIQNVRVTIKITNYGSNRLCNRDELDECLPHEEKEAQLSQKYFPDEENIWARPNIEAQRCKSACIEMVEWFKAQKGE